MGTANRGGVIGLDQTAVLDASIKSEHFPALGGLVKRAFDVTIATFILVVLAPLFLFTALAIWMTSGGPVFYAHRRVGLGGRHFHCLKFRTMCSDASEVLRRHLDQDPVARAEWNSSRKLRNDPRVTPLGRVLREYSVDELPQLLNVVRGDMSLVGPRPVVEDELSYYGVEAAAYCSARPGITGDWQVSGRSDTDYARRVALDAEYVRRWSIGRDLWILLRTIPAVLGARGSY